MKKSDVIKIDNTLNSIKLNFKPEDYKPFSYVFLRNQLKFKSVIEERNSIQSELLSSNISEEDIENYLNSKEEWVKFLDEDTEIELFTLKIDSIEKQEFDLRIAEYLVSVNILVE